MASNRIPSFLIGLGVGAAFGLLVAPSRGDKTREGLRRTATDGCDLVRRGSEEFRKSAGSVMDWSKEILESQRVNLESAYQAGMDAYRSKAGEF